MLNILNFENFNCLIKRTVYNETIWNLFVNGINMYIYLFLRPLPRFLTSLNNNKP